MTSLLRDFCPRLLQLTITRCLLYESNTSNSSHSSSSSSSQESVLMYSRSIEVLISRKDKSYRSVCWRSQHQDAICDTDKSKHHGIPAAWIGTAALACASGPDTAMPPAAQLVAESHYAILHHHKPMLSTSDSTFTQ